LLTRVRKPLLRKSQVIIDGKIRDTEGRTSSTAFLPEEDPVVASVIQRAAEFQGYLSPKDIEVQVTSYQPGQEVKYHYDGYADGSRPTNRISTFFAILKSNCQDCGTQFPFINTTLRHQYDSRWCDVIDCEKDVLTTKNVEGSALFWVNLDQAGKERKDMLHAGLPALNGEKVGLNVWTEPDLAELKNRGLFNSHSQHYLEAFPQGPRR
jgi:prolyl 4-hydroxylase